MKKIFPIWLTAASVSLLALNSCGEKKESPKTDKDKSVETATTAKPETPAQAPVVKQVSPEQRAKLLGFMSKVPKTNSFAMGIYNGSSICNSIKAAITDPNNPIHLFLLATSKTTIEEQPKVIENPKLEGNNAQAPQAPKTVVVEIKDGQQGPVAVVENGQIVPVQGEEITSVEGEGLNAKDVATVIGGDVAGDIAGEIENSLEPAKEFFQKSIIISTDQKTPVQFNNISKISSEISAFMSYDQILTLATSASAAPPSKTIIDGEEDEEATAKKAWEKYHADRRKIDQELIEKINQNSEAYLALVKVSELPTCMVATECSKESATNLIDNITGELENFVNFSEGVIGAYETKIDEALFKGVQIDGKKLAEVLTQESANEKDLPKDMDKFLNLIKEKNIYLVFGYVHNNLVMFLSSDATTMKFAQNVNDSILANPDFNIGDSYINPDSGEIKGTIFSAIYSSADLEKANYATMKESSPYIKGALWAMQNDLITSTFGDIRPMEVLLKSVDEQLKNYVSPTAYGPSQFIAMGTDQDVEIKATLQTLGVSGLDFSKPISTSNLLENENTLLYFGARTDPKQTAKTAKLVNTLGELTYLASTYYAGSAFKDEQFAATFEMFNKMYKDDGYVIWSNFSNALANGLDNEWTVVMDNKGTLPGLPMIPPVIVSEARIPRLAMVAEVKDRKVLSQSWDEIYKSLSNVYLKTPLAQQMALPMPSSSEKNDLKTWFFQIPGANDNFSPSLMLNDSRFIVGTSPNYNSEILSEIKTKSGNKKGAYFMFKTKPLADLCDENIAMLIKNAGTLNELVPEMKLDPKELEASRKHFKNLPNYVREISGSVTLENNQEVYRLKFTK